MPNNLTSPTADSLQHIQWLLDQARAMHTAGQIQKAEQAYRAILAIHPGVADAAMGLGVIAAQIGRLDTAMQIMSDLVKGFPKNAVFLGNLASIYVRLGQVDKAIEAYRRTIELDPKLQMAYSNLLTIFTDRSQLDAAREVVRQAKENGVDITAGLPAFYGMESRNFQDQAKFVEALHTNDLALAINPNIPQMHWNRALFLLTLGRYPEGWAEYEWRWKCDNFPYKRRVYTQPEWDGCSLVGKRLLLDTEGGFGDIIQFIRYAKMVKQTGATVIVGCPVQLKPLLCSAAGIDELIVGGDAVPPIDYHFQLLSCPLRFGTTVDTVPNEVPYLSAPSDRVAAWKGKVRGNDPSVKQVGLVWAGRPAPYPNRTCPLPSCKPLFDVPGIRFHSLQLEEGKADLAGAPREWNLVDHVNDLKDFGETSAIVENLDLVITIDSAVAHVAGALARPTWVMVPFSPDWRWEPEGDTCRWYPTMRLFRQTAIGDWLGLTTRVAAALREHFHLS